MKLSPLILLSFLPLLSLADPMAEASPVELESREDKWCTLYPGVDNVNCREYETTYSPSLRMIRAGERFGVACKIIDGEPVKGKRVWDYIPGWNCHVSARYTSAGCEGKFFCHESSKPSRLQNLILRNHRWGASVSSPVIESSVDAGVCKEISRYDQLEGSCTRPTFF